MKKIIKLALVLVLAISPLITKVTPAFASGEDSIEEFGATIVAAGTFWENWWNFEGPFASEHIGEPATAEHLEEFSLNQLLPTSGFESIDDIRNYLLQYYTENGLEAQSGLVTYYFSSMAIFEEYDGNLYVHTARAGVVRPDWTTAEHTLIEQSENRAIVETTVLVAGWHREPYMEINPFESTYRFTLVNGRIDQIEKISENEPATEAPTTAETVPPTEAATVAPTVSPTEAATDAPTEAPTESATEASTAAATKPSEVPTTTTTGPTTPQTLPQTGAVAGVSAAITGVCVAILGGLAAYGKAKKGN